MRLTVKQLKSREPGAGMAVIDREAVQSSDLTSGDFVRLAGRDGSVVARVWPSDADDAGRGIVRIDGQLRRAAGVGVEAVCREAAAVAVREHVHATAGGEDSDVAGIELTADHFERALEAVEPTERDEFAEADERPSAPAD